MMTKRRTKVKTMCTHQKRRIARKTLLVGLVALFAVTPLTASIAEAAAPAKTQGGPVLQYEQFRRRVEFKVADKREAQITGLQRLLKLGIDSEEVPDVKFRLADLYFEKSQFYFFRTQETEDEIHEAESPDKKESLTAQRDVYAKEAKLWSRRATQIYQEIRENYPRYPRLPEVLFALGQNYWSRGMRDDAIDVYRDLIREYEDSPLVADAWLAFGEYYFSKGALEQALKSYEIAASDKRSKVYGFALYKQAWCYYNLSNWEMSLRKFQATVFYSQMADELSGENRISLAREAEKDYVKTYAHVGDPARAKMVLAEVSNVDECTDKKCLSLMELLGDEWRTQGKFDPASYVYRQLIALQPKSFRNAYFQSVVVDMAARAGNKDQVIEEVRSLVSLYLDLRERKKRGALGKELKQINSAISESRRTAEDNIRRLAQTWNQEAVKTRQKKTSKQALAMYSDYLKLFPKAKLAYDLRFQMADLLYRLEDFSGAAKAYRDTVEADPKGKYLVSAARDGIIAIEEHLRDLRLKKVKPSKEPVGIHPERQRLIDACDRYVRSVAATKADDMVKIQLKAAKIFYQHGHFDDALTRFEQITAEFPSAEESEIAANLVIDIHNLRQDWNALYRSASAYLKRRNLLKGRTKLKNDLIRFGQHAKFKLISMEQEKLQADNLSLKPIAESYEQFQAEFPTSENADRALFNASVVWDSLGDKIRADTIRDRLLTQYPDSSLRADVAIYTARSFESQAKYRRAAELFSSFAIKYPKDKRARDALYNAAVFYAGVGEVQSSTKLRERYLKLYGKAKRGSEEAADIYYSIASDLERSKRLRQAALRYGEFAKLFSKDDRYYDALWREARIYRALKQKKKAVSAESKLFAAFQKRVKKKKRIPPQAADYASQVAFLKLNDDFGKYSRLRLKPLNLKRPQKFQRSMQEKAQMRDRMITSYGRIVTEYRQAKSTISALFRIAKTWDIFVDTLLKVPCPKSLTEEQCSFFKQGLEEKMSNAREAAYQAYVTCVEKSNELGVFTMESTQCVKALESIDPEQYPKIEEQRLLYDAKKQALVIKSQGLIYRVPSKKQAAVQLKKGGTK